MNLGKDFNKYALDKTTFSSSKIEEIVSNQITPYILVERDRNFNQIDVLTYLIEKRIVSVNGTITADMISLLRAQVSYLSELDTNEDIQMYIDSGGGSVHAGFSLYDTMMYVPNDIATFNMGMCASMASVLVSAGAIGKRGGLPNSTVMLHQASGGSQGQIENMKVSQQQIEIANARLFKILAQNAGKTYEQVMEKCQYVDFWMWGEEAVEFGLIDFIVKSKKNNPNTNNLVFTEVGK